MASTIRARIQLDGAEDVTSQLQKLKSVFTDTGAAAEAIGNSFSNIVGVVRNAVAAFALIEAAAITTTAAFSKLGSNATHAIDSIGDSADAVGLSVQEYQKLSGAAEAAGVAIGSIDRILRKIAVDAEEAANGTSKFAEKYRDAGVKLTEFDGTAKSTTQILLELADVYAKMDESKRPAFLKSIGFRLKDAAELAQMLSLGAKGIEEFIAISDKVKYVPTDKDNAIVARSIAAASLLKDAWQKFTIEVGKAFIPLSASIDIGLINLILRITQPLASLTEYIASKARPVIEDFFNMLTGGKDFNNMQFVIWQQQLESILAIIPTYYSTYIEPFISGLVSGFQTGFNLIVSVATTAINALSSVFSPIAAALEPLRAALATIITPEVIGYFAGFAASIAFVLIPALNAISPVIGLVVSSIGLLAAALGPGGLLFLAVSTIAFLVSTNWDLISAKTVEVFNGIAAIISNGISAAASYVSSGLDAIAGYFISKFDSIRVGIEGFFTWLSSAISSALASISDIGAKAASAISGASTPFATGGYVSGPGTGTSDSIPAWLSNGEFVIKASAVRKFGLGLLNSINNGFMPPALSNGRYGYADGGLVGATSGGISGRSLTLVIDGRKFGGLSGTNDAIESLEKYSALRQISSTTKRAPSRIG